MTQNMNIIENSEDIYAYLIATHREYIVRTLILSAIKGQNICYIKFDTIKFSYNFGSPSEILRETIIRIINSDIRLAGVTILVEKDEKTVIFLW